MYFLYLCGKTDIYTKPHKNRSIPRSPSIQICVVQRKFYTNLCGTTEILYKTSQEALHPREPGYTNVGGIMEVLYKVV